MKSISNRQYALLVEKLPRVLQMARTGSKAVTLRQCEDIRQLSLLHLQLKNKLSTSLNHTSK
jgi:hypothetical protein